MEDLTHEPTTITDPPTVPENTRDALDVTALGFVPLNGIPAAPELLPGFADAFSNFRAVSSLSSLLVLAGLGGFGLLLGRIVSERGSFSEVLGVGFAFADMSKDLMAAAADSD